MKTMMSTSPFPCEPGIFPSNTRVDKLSCRHADCHNDGMVLAGSDLDEEA